MTHLNNNSMRCNSLKKYALQAYVRSKIYEYTLRLIKEVF